MRLFLIVLLISSSLAVDHSYADDIMDNSNERDATLYTHPMLSTIAA
jgi:hypothetical protein